MSDTELQDLLSDLAGEVSDPVNKTSEPDSEDDTVVDHPHGGKPQLVKQQSKKESAVVTLDLNKIVDAHDKDYQTVMANLRNDRTKIDGVISKLMEKLEDGAKAAEIEALVKALDTQANTSNCIVRLMDSRSKMITALKHHLVGSKVNTGPSDTDEELTQLLSQPEDKV